MLAGRLKSRWMVDAVGGRDHTSEELHVSTTYGHVSYLPANPDA